MRLKSSYNLYHGTTHEKAESIKNSGTFEYKPREDHWLGDGVYFFINDYKKAKWWGKQACKIVTKNGETTSGPKVLFIESYTLMRDQLLDLDTEEDKLKFFNFIKKLGTVEFSGSTEKKRATYINYYSKMFNIVAAKYTFTKDKHIPNLTDLGIYSTEPQFCIKDLSSIDVNKVKIV